jgi:hypothetical protein
MGSPKGDWGPTRDPKRNAQIRRQVEKEAAAEAAFLRHLQAFRERRAEKLPTMVAHINDQIPHLLDSWAIWVNGAITDADYPIEDATKDYWLIALAGNLIWAATCFIDPALPIAITLIKVMSVSGAVIGAGAPEKLGPPPANPPSPKEKIRDQLAKARGRLQREYTAKSREWASRFIRLQDWDVNDTTIVEEFNVYLWSQMFPTIPYDDDRFSKILEMAKTAVGSAVADYNRQWAECKRKNKWAGPAELLKHGDFRPVIRVSFAGKPLWDTSDIANRGGDLRFH